MVGVRMLKQLLTIVYQLFGLALLLIVGLAVGTTLAMVVFLYLFRWLGVI